MTKEERAAITKHDLEIHSNYLIERRLTKTNSNLIKEREGKGSKKFKYVTKHTAYRWLDLHYPGLWSFTITERFYDDLMLHYYVCAKIKVKDPLTGFIQEFDDIGISETKKSGDKIVEQMYYKNACSDAFKRCAVQVGAFNDVYSEDDEGFLDIASVDWTTILDNIDKGKAKFTSDQLGNQFASILFGNLTIDKLLKAWDVS